ncbi:MAG: hypothetical protein GY757_03110, partial [bacterium]|nr:hypothetical protein [bacterium]
GTIASSIPAGNGSYSWNVGQLSGGNWAAATDSYYITVEESGGVCSGSSGLFTIVPSITVTSPTGGEYWQLGSTQTITWSSKGLDGKKVDISLMRNSGGFVGYIAGAIPIGDGSYSWTPGELPNGVVPVPDDSYYIVVETVNSQYFDSGNHFTITQTQEPKITVTSPGGGANLIRGNTYQIKWSKSGTMPDRVKIKLKRNGTAVQAITYDAPNNGIFTWTVPETVEPQPDYVIKVRVNGSTIYDESSLFQVSCSAPQTYTIYAKYALEHWAPRWEWASRAMNAPDGWVAIQPFFQGNEKTDPLIAHVFDRSWTLPAGKTITNVKIGAKVAWEQPYQAGPIWLAECTHSRWSGWINYTGSTLTWVELDITSAETTWTKAKIDALQVSIQRRWGDVPYLDFYVDAYRIVITTN